MYVPIQCTNNVCIVCCSNVRVETISSFGTIMQAVTSKDVSSTPLHTHKLKITSWMYVSTHNTYIFAVEFNWLVVWCRQILVRVHEQFEWFLSHDQHRRDHQVLMALLHTLASIGPHADPVFRDKC